MPFHIEWYLPHRAIDVRLAGVVTLADMREQTEVICAMLVEAAYAAPAAKVIVLLDTTAVESMPPAYLMLQQALPVLKMKNRGGVFHVTRSKTTRSILELTAHVMRFQVRAAATRDEAVKMMESALLHDDMRQVQSSE